MAKLFSVFSWNVEHFKLKNKDVNRILSHINRFDPDVLAIHEVEGKDVYQHMVSKFTGYNFHITEGPQTQEILVGVRGSFTSFYSQKVEFKTGNDLLRPGALLSLRINSEDYTMLFLHTKSFPEPIGLGTRDSQFKHAFNLKRKLDKVAGGAGKAKFIIVGDLNIMGMNYPFNKNIEPSIELKKFAKDADRREMRVLGKDYEHTWTDGKRFGDLDHVVASDGLKFKSWGNGYDVKVSGWRELKDSNNGQFKGFLKGVSDHNSIYFEVV